MSLSKYLSTARGSYAFMLCCGFAMGVIFPFYSFLFFGRAAFGFFYAGGCLVAGLVVGGFCCYVLQEALKGLLTRQRETLAPLVQREAEGDELRHLVARHDLVVERLIAMAGSVSGLAGLIADHGAAIRESAQKVVCDCSDAGASGERTLNAAQELEAGFRCIMREIESLAQGSGERASISTQMAATTDSIASTMRDYSTAVLETSLSIGEMAGRIRETAANVSALAASTEQTVSSITAIGSAVEEVRDHARNCAEASEGVQLQAQEGLGATAATIRAMHDIEHANEEAHRAIGRLSIHSARVGDLIKVIHEVVAHTNLLSLNASIIAAQAGEQGKGFAVVAGEVRALALRTASSAQEIDQLVQGIRIETAAVRESVALGRTRVAEGVRIASHSDEALQKIEQGATRASLMVGRIAAATVEQAAQTRLIEAEAEKNLERVRQITTGTVAQEGETDRIVQALDQMRALSQRVTVTTDEQSRTNRHFLQGVLADDERLKRLAEVCLDQQQRGVLLFDSLAEAAALRERTSEEARRDLEEAGVIARLADDLRDEMRPFAALVAPRPAQEAEPPSVAARRRSGRTPRSSGTPSTTDSRSIS